MKTLHLKLFYLLFGISLITFGQTLEKTYETKGDETLNAPSNFFYINSDLYFFTLNNINNGVVVKLYNSNHTETKSISTSYQMTKVFLFSNNLFNSDDKIEFLANVWDDNNVTNKIILFNEDGTQLFDFGAVGGYSNLTKDQNNNYKLLLSEEYHKKIKVYGLSGTLSNKQENLYLNKVNTFPNPSSNVINITNLNTHNGIIDIFTVTGKKVLSKKVDKSLKKVSINVSSLSSGVYLYKIGGISKRFVKQ